MIRATAAIVALVLALSFPVVASAMQQAKVIAGTYTGGDTFLVVHVALLKGIANASAISFQLPLGAAPPPSSNPGYSATAQVLHRDPAGDTDDPLGPAEQTFP